MRRIPLALIAHVCLLACLPAVSICAAQAPVALPYTMTTIHREWHGLSRRADQLGISLGHNQPALQHKRLQHLCRLRRRRRQRRFHFCYAIRRRDSRAHHDSALGRHDDRNTRSSGCAHRQPSPHLSAHQRER